MEHGAVDMFDLNIHVSLLFCLLCLREIYIRPWQLTHQEPPNRGLDPQNG